MAISKFEARKELYRRGELTGELKEVFDELYKRGEITLDDNNLPEQPPEQTSQDPTFLERNLPLIKEDLRGLSKQLLPQLAKGITSIYPVPDEQIGVGRDVIKKLIDNPGLLKQVPGLLKQAPGQILESFTESGKALINPSIQEVPEYERLKAGADIAGTLVGTGAGAKLAYKGMGAGYKGAKKLFGSKPGVISRTEFDTARDVLEKPNIKEVLSGSKRVPIGKFTDPRFINKIGSDTAKRLDALKESIIAKQSAAVPDTLLPAGLNKKILTSLKKERILEPTFKTVEKPLTNLEKMGREARFDYSKTRKVRRPITEIDTPEEILEATTAIKAGKTTSKANLQTLIKDIQSPNLTAKKAYALRRKADDSINFNDTKEIQRPYKKIRDILDDALRDPEFNPKWKEYGKETDNLSSLLYNKKVKGLMEETDPKKTTFSFGEKLLSAKPGAQTGFREVVSKLDLDEKQRGLKDVITEGLDTIEMSKAYKEVSAPLLKKIPFGVGEFGEDIYKRSIPIRQGAGFLGKSIKTFKGVGKANLLQRAADGSYTEQTKQQLQNNQNKP